MAFKNAVIRCARRVCGMKRLSKRGIRKGSEWWNEEVARLMRNKKDMYKMWLQNSRVTPDIRLVSGYPAIRPVFQVSGYPAG